MSPEKRQNNGDVFFSFRSLERESRRCRNFLFFSNRKRKRAEEDDHLALIRRFFESAGKRMSSSSSSSSSSSMRDKETFERIQMIFGIYLIPMLCLPGLLSNILCLIVFLSKTSMRRFVTTEFLLHLAISDTIKLSNDLLYSIVLIIQMINQRVGKRVFLLLYRSCHYINAVSTLCTAWLTPCRGHRTVSSLFNHSESISDVRFLRLDLFLAVQIFKVV